MLQLDDRQLRQLQICLLYTSAMPREDYDRFRSLAGQGLKKPYELQTNENDSGIFRGGLMRFRNSDTTGVEIQDVERFCNWGIWIDILALDYIYKDEAKRREQFRKIGIYKRLCMPVSYTHLDVYKRQENCLGYTYNSRCG